MHFPYNVKFQIENDIPIQIIWNCVVILTNFKVHY